MSKKTIGILKSQHDWFNSTNDEYYKTLDKIQKKDFEMYLDQMRLVYEIKQGIKNEDRLTESERQKLILPNIELNIGNECSLKCSYCYLNKYGNKLKEFGLYPTKETSIKIHLENIEKLLRFLINNKYTPKELEIYGGDPLFKQQGIEILKFIYNLYKNVDNQLKPNMIIIPSNFTWIQFDDKIKQIEELIDKFKNINIKLLLSISFDGLLELKNRKQISQRLENVLNRNEEYIDKLFRFQKKYDYGFHPMIYSKHIDKWIDNFLWFQKMFYKYDISPYSLYLLEIRNPEWSRQEIIEFGIFIRFLLEFLNKVLQTDEKEFQMNIKNVQFNILSHPFIRVGRGIGCSLQTTLHINTSDLTVQQCHRNNYKSNYGYKLIINDKKNEIRTKQNNIEYYSLLKNFTVQNQPYCESCQINSLCMGQCPGQQYEVFKNPTTPIPTVCLMEHIKNQQILYTIHEKQLLPYIGLVLGKRRNFLDKQENMMFKYLEFIMENNNLINVLKSKDKLIEKKINDFLKILKLNKEKIPIFNENERGIYYG